MMDLGGVFSFVVTLALFVGCGQCQSCPCEIKPSLHYSGTNYVACDENGLFEIPSDCFDQTISEIDIASNAVTSIRAHDFSKAPNLKRVYADYNDIKFIDEKAFANHPGMERIYLNQNQHLDLLEGVFSGLSHLQELHIFGSPIQRLPDITDLTSLKLLDIRDCSIAHFRRPTFGKIKSDEFYLDMSGNLVTDLALDVILDLPDHSEFNFDYDLILWAKDEGEREKALNKPWTMNISFKNIKVCGLDGLPGDPAMCDFKGQ